MNNTPADHAAESLIRGSLIHKAAFDFVQGGLPAVTAALQALGSDLVFDPTSNYYSAKKSVAQVAKEAAASVAAMKLSFDAEKARLDHEAKMAIEATEARDRARAEAAARERTVATTVAREQADAMAARTAHPIPGAPIPPATTFPQGYVHNPIGAGKPAIDAPTVPHVPGAPVPPVAPVVPRTPVSPAVCPVAGCKLPMPHSHPAKV
jgi:hypothetical protein